ncbi:thioredoxin-like protein [Gonapodya prolifera JEL478]|uniref:Thioredoxin-like protein n=1 Tax=Gonapodya prolifera (strain JEL478) TaxID=1344416 RepID=A0A139ALH4_GONPJ|nr:thioredoxin-like protein [Gonapodya prolifera JEL478]|eukprot:KXS17642.1 thioredoxin-like protein [Gonapodya prolifera JEL478]
MPKPVLYHALGSRSIRTLWLLHELGLQNEVEVVQLALGGESVKFKDKNPNAKFPTFVDSDGTSVWESAAITQYLAEKHGKFLPARGTTQYAKYLSYMYWTVVNFDSIAFPLYVQLAFTPEAKRDKALIASKIAELRSTYLPQLEGLLKEFKGPFLLGKELTGLDIQVGVPLQALNHPRVQLLKDFPVVLEYLNKLLERPGFRIAHRLKPKL